MTDRLRAVFDTNVFVLALLSRNPTSPTRELMARWHNDEFTLLVCDALVDKADYLVTYDPHFDVVSGEHCGVKIARALPFLWAASWIPRTARRRWRKRASLACSSGFYKYPKLSSTSLPAKISISANRCSANSTARGRVNRPRITLTLDSRRS